MGHPILRPWGGGTTVRPLESGVSRRAAGRGRYLVAAALTLAAVLGAVRAQEPFVPVTDAVLRNPDPADWLRWRRDHTNIGRCSTSRGHRP